MGSFFKSLIYIICLLVIIASGGVIVYKYEQRAASDFATDAANDISVSWDSGEMEKRAHPEMVNNLAKSGHSMKEYFSVLSQLGVLKTVIDCTLIRSGITDFPELYLSADYVCHGDYEKGHATLLIGLRQDIKKDAIPGTWRVWQFHVDSPVFSQR